MLDVARLFDGAGLDSARFQNGSTELTWRERNALSRRVDELGSLAFAEIFLDSDDGRTEETASGHRPDVRTLLDVMAMLQWPFQFDRPMFLEPARLVDDWQVAFNELREFFPGNFDADAITRSMQEAERLDDERRKDQDDSSAILTAARDAVHYAVVEAITAAEIRYDQTITEWFGDHISPEIERYIENWSLLFIERNDSKKAWFKNNIEKFARPTVSVTYRAAEIEEGEGERARIRKAMPGILERMTGVPARQLRNMTMDEWKELGKEPSEKARTIKKRIKARKQVSEADEDLAEAHTEFEREKRNHKRIIDNYVMNLVIENGGPVDITKVRTELRRRKVDGYDDQYPKGFVGKIGAARKAGARSLSLQFFTRFNEMMELRPSGKVAMNPQYKEGGRMHYCRWVPTFSKTGEETHGYTLDAAVRQRGQEKARKVDVLMEMLNRGRFPWRGDLMSDGSRNQAVAAVVEFLYQTAARVGSEQRIGAGSFGASTLMRKHARFGGVVQKGGRKVATKAMVEYAQKTKKDHKYVIDSTDPELDEGDVRYVRKLLEIMGDNSKTMQGQTKEDAADNRLFRFDNGRPITSSRVNTYLRSKKMPSSHKFRHARGTKLMQAELDSLKAGMQDARPDPKMLLEKYMEAATKVAVTLHHSIRRDGEDKPNANTSIKSYISPTLTRAWFEEHGADVPARIDKLISAGDEDDD